MAKAVIRVRMNAGAYPKLFLSLVGTPVLLFISPSITVYLSSQAELNHEVAVIYPFVVVGLGTLALAAAYCMTLGYGSARQSEAKALTTPVAAYFLAGPLFLAYTLLREMPVPLLDQLAGVLLGGAALLIGAKLLATRTNVQTVVGFFAVLSVAFFFSESYRLASGIEQRPLQVEAPETEFPVTEQGKSLPNIYHIILDGYQSDIFSFTLTDRVKSEMEGFTWYSETTALYDQTVWSVPSVMLGAQYDYAKSHEQYQSEAFNSAASMLHELRSAGYLTVAYSRKLYQFDYDLFDVMTEHIDNMGTATLDDTNDFVTLWVYRNMPEVVRQAMAARNLLISQADIKNLGAQTFLADSAALESKLSFDNILIEEADLPAAGRYTFVHLGVPHDPFVLEADCTESRSSNVVTQSQCATLLVTRLLSRLKELDRYDESLIVIHGDHGERYRADGTNLTEIEHRSHRTLLLLKPPASAARQKFVASGIEATLLDIAPTIYDFVGSQSSLHEGASLVREEHSSFVGRKRTYSVANGETSLRQHRVDGHNLILENDRPIPVDSGNIATLISAAASAPLNQVIEAESGTLTKNTSVDSRLPGANGAYTSNGSVKFRFELTEPAMVQLQARLVAPGANNNSSYVRIDNDEAKIWHMNITKTWNWQAFDSSWMLAPGEHLLSIESREQIFLDQLRLVAEEI
ncbi:MAG: hypothetical protein ACR2QR_09870 [Woeseiaceae bacterium]